MTAEVRPSLLKVSPPRTARAVLRRPVVHRVDSKFLLLAGGPLRRPATGGLVVQIGVCSMAGLI
jgi:hypothetical protein